MHFPRRFKYLWWFTLLVGTSFVIYLRKDFIFGNTPPQIFDTVLLAITTGIALIPFFTEFSMLGITLKQRIEDKENEYDENKNLNNNIQEVKPLDQKNNIDLNNQETSPNLQSIPNSPDEDNELFNIMINTIIEKDFEKGKELLEKIQKIEPDINLKLKNEAFYYYLCYSQGEVKSLEDLHKLSDRSKRNPEVYAITLRLLGYAYEAANNLQKSIQIYSEAIDNATDEKQSSEITVQLAYWKYKVGDKDSAFELLFAAVQKFTSPDAISHIYNGLAKLYDFSGKSELQAIALEKAVEANPKNIDARFSAAYNYSESDRGLLSIFHYMTLIRLKSMEAASYNNLGIAFDQLNMPFTAIRYYKEAAKMGNTLAAANLAFEYIDSGFADEAQETLDKARKGEKIHANVGSAIAKLSSKQEDEDNKIISIQNTAQQQQIFLLSLANYLFYPEDIIIDLSGEWVSKNNELVNIIQSSSKIELLWQDNNKENKIIGLLTKSVIIGELRSRKVISGNNLSSHEEKEGYIHAYYDETLQQIKFMLTNNQSLRFMELSRKIS